MRSIEPACISCASKPRTASRWRACCTSRNAQSDACRDLSARHRRLVGVRVEAHERARRGASRAPASPTFRSTTAARTSCAASGDDLGGCAYERIRDCVLDIDGAVRELRRRGYRDITLIGHSTGANKIAVYDSLQAAQPASSATCSSAAATIPACSTTTSARAASSPR